MASEKKLDRTIKIIGILLILMLIPILILMFIYNTNDKFRLTTNENLRQVPGFIGNYFNEYPTEDEKKDKIKYIAKYYVNLDKSVAGDKLYIIKKNDEQLYLDIIQSMKLESLNKTEDIVKQVRNIELRKDSVISIYDDIEKEKEEKILEEYKRFDKLTTDIAIIEIKENYLNDYANFEKLISILKNMKKDKLIDILFYIDDDSKNIILNKMKINDTIFYNEVKSLILEKEKNQLELKQIADMYKVMNADKAFNDLGNEDKFNIKELSVIYTNLDPKKSAEILANSDSTDFIDQLFVNIRTIELLSNKTDSVTVDITNELTKINNYNNKKQELISLYEKMNSSDAARLIEKMFVTEPDMIIDILLTMNKTKASDILNSIETRTATAISKKIFN